MMSSIKSNKIPLSSFLHHFAFHPHIPYIPWKVIHRSLYLVVSAPTSVQPKPGWSITFLYLILLDSQQHLKVQTASFFSKWLLLLVCLMIHFPECPPTPEACLLSFFFFFLVNSLALVTPPPHVRVSQESALSQLMVSTWYCLPLNMFKNQTQHPLSSHIPISISYHHILSWSCQKCRGGDGKKFWISGNGCTTLWIW